MHEFCVALNEADANRSVKIPWMRFSIRGKEISISPLEIATYYDVPLNLCDFVQLTNLMFFPRENMKNIIKLLMDMKGEWKHHLRMNYPISFSHAKLTLTKRMWLKFISIRIFLATDISNIDIF